MRTYEAMLLVEPTTAAREWGKVTEEIERAVTKHGGSVINVQKWGERKLAYPVKRSKRGTYVLAYLALPEPSIPRVKNEFNLSEILFRHLLLQHEGELRKEPPRDFETAGTGRRVDETRMRGGDFREPREHREPR